MSHALAYAYCEYGLNLGYSSYTELSDVLNSSINYNYYRRLPFDKQEFAYRFNEYNINDTQKSYPHFTNRIITKWSNAYFSYNVTNYQ